jgi:hypothetical protein
VALTLNWQRDFITYVLEISYAQRMQAACAACVALMITWFKRFIQQGVYYEREMVQVDIYLRVRAQISFAGTVPLGSFGGSFKARELRQLGINI